MEANEKTTETEVTPAKKTNGLAITGFILSFLIPIAGLICSIIALVQINKRQEQGKGLAIAGIVISVIGLFIGFMLLVALIVGAIGGARDASTEVLHRGNARNAQIGLEMYYAENGAYPVCDATISGAAVGCLKEAELELTNTSCPNGGGFVKSMATDYEITVYKKDCKTALETIKY